ncbi:DNA-formamidopyrimidine glycosylase family protein [Pseudokineococcus basanitobsidens]|uniref:DNA-(apurinic or apyrimidinic site) lyase n=1 Tax=Pseudokineococcus basanitobsidens TaxID=1926649 RepID=A0ABU8RK11_9ACTN
MPEGDSVYLVARTLDARLRGTVVARSDLRVPRHATADLSGRAVLGTSSVGKHLLTRFGGGITLHTHLRMDGSWTVLAPGKVLPRRVQPDVRVLLTTTGGPGVVDGAPGPTAAALQMPVVELVETAHEDDVVGHLGPDLLGPGWARGGPDEAVRRLAGRPARGIKPALLDQRNLAGVGNLWADETCFLRGLDPWTPVGDVDLPPLVALAARMLRHSATAPGAYQVTTGDTRRGRSHWVVGRAGRPCLRCGTTVLVREEVAGDPEQRRTWWCPRCQPEPPVRAEPGSG